MHAYDDQISTMVYELYLLKRNELGASQSWVEALWKRDEPPQLTQQEQLDLFALHRKYVLGSTEGLNMPRLNHKGDMMSEGVRRNTVRFGLHQNDGRKQQSIKDTNYRH
jgi:hypothetical protein